MDLIREKPVIAASQDGGRDVRPLGQRKESLDAFLQFCCERPAADNSAAPLSASVYSVCVSLTSQVPTLNALHALNPRQPAYSSPHELAGVVGKLRTLPPLVFAAECDKLRAKMASVAAGGAFMLQGGDVPRPLPM